MLPFINELWRPGRRRRRSLAPAPPPPRRLLPPRPPPLLAPPLPPLLQALLLLLLLTLQPRCVRGATATPSPTPGPQACSLGYYNQIWDYEMRYQSVPVTGGCLSLDRVTTFPRVVDNVTGVLETWCAESAYLSVQCRAQIDTVTYQPFGPPSAFEVMNVVCKGQCMAYYNRYKRLQHSKGTSGCECGQAGKVQCPIHPLVMLFRATGLSYDPDFYWESTCQPYSCGRYLTDEDSYRKARKACKLSFDGAGAAHPAAAVLALAAAAALVAAVR